MIDIVMGDVSTVLSGPLKNLSVTLLVKLFIKINVSQSVPKVTMWFRPSQELAQKN